MRYLYVFIVLLIVSCTPNYTAQQIVDNAIKNAQLNKLLVAEVSFDFRKKQYNAIRANGVYTYTKTDDRDSIVIKDVLTNTNFKRFVNDSLIELSDKDKSKYANAVNSVHYFSILPLGLNDKAVQKKMLDPVIIKGKEYFKMEVTFTKEGGGDDFDDVFLYWFAKDNFQLDYLAYKYHTNGGGVRFRDVKKEHVVNGIRLADYNNYKPLTKDIDFSTIDKLYKEEKLKKISEIVLENIKITINR